MNDINEAIEQAESDMKLANYALVLITIPVTALVIHLVQALA